MERVCIGVPVHAVARNLRTTIDCLRANTAEPFTLILLPDGPDEETVAALAEVSEYPQLGTQDARGAAACFNRLAQNSDSEFVVLLESGVFVGTGWLERLLKALDSDPCYGLAGPSTNRAWNEQRAFPCAGPSFAEVARTAQEALRRYGDAHRTLEPLYSLGDFCYLVRRTVVDGVGKADEQYGLGPCWEMDYNIRAARAGFQGVWACSSYVYRSALTQRQSMEERTRLEASKRRYQDKFCGLRLQGQKNDYRSHCRGDACPNFCPPKPGPLRIVSLPAAPIDKIEVKAASCESLASCIMPTCDRRRFVPQAIQYFLRQDYPERELIIVDDGSDTIRDLVPDDPRIRYVKMASKATLGAKRNLACAEARGEFILHWDDDDWMANHRVSYQVSSLKRSNADICGLDSLLFYQPATGQSWRYVCGVRSRSWAAGGTLCYRKSFWKTNPFPSLTIGEDTRFVWSSRSTRLLVLPDHSFYVAIIHDRNTSPKRTSDAQWQACPATSLDSLFGADAPFYGRRTEASAMVSCIMPTRDRPDYVRRAISYFQRQDHPNRELIVVDDGDAPVSCVVPADPSIHYHRLPTRHTVGEKRNFAVHHANGRYIVHWDDDDWYASSRLSRQVRSLEEGRADVTALSMRTVLELPEFRFWRCRPELHARLHHRDICCGTIAYERRLWEKHGPYPRLNCGEDVRFLTSLGKGARVERLPDEDLFICVRHGRNTWRLDLDWKREPRGWQQISSPDFLPAEDLAHYQAVLSSSGQMAGVM